MDQGLNTLDEQRYIPLAKYKCWTKQEMPDKINISAPAYKQYPKNELLKSMCFKGGDEFFGDILLKDMEESRRYVRIRNTRAHLCQ